jgi:hypothetical protein
LQGVLTTHSDRTELAERDRPGLRRTLASRAAVPSFEPRANDGPRAEPETLRSPKFESARFAKPSKGDPVTDKDKAVVVPLLFEKREPVAAATAEQYVGTDTELDIK